MHSLTEGTTMQQQIGTPAAPPPADSMARALEDYLAAAEAGTAPPHIVHVHAVGCERAVHFYAMQFIEGQTLAALIADLRQRGGRPANDAEQPTTPHAPGQPEPAPDTAPRAAASTERAPRDRAHF